jgi:hypothetical protein
MTAEPGRPFKLAVLPVQGVPDAAEPLVRASVTDRLAASKSFELAADTEVARALSVYGSTADLSPAQLRELGRSLGVQGVLSLEAGGWGRLPPSWLALLLASGAVEATVQGVVVGELAGPTAGAAVAALELAQETLEWTGGAWLFSRFFTPVALRARLWSAADGEKVWGKTSFASYNLSKVRALPKEERTRAAKLRWTADKTAEELTDSLNKTARRNLGAH